MLTPPPGILVNMERFYFCTPYLFFLNLLLKFLVVKSLFFIYHINFYQIYFILFLTNINFPLAVAFPELGGKRIVFLGA